MSARSSKRIAIALCATLSSAAWTMLAFAAPATKAPGATPVDDIRDIRPLIAIPRGFPWLIAGLAAAALLGATYVAIRYYRRRAQRPLSAQQRAALGLARAEQLARNGECHEWAEVVAETLRAALAARLGQAACPETTTELATRDWSELPAQCVDATRLVELLSTCDLTRFALGRLESSALLRATESARVFVERLFAPTEAIPNTPTKAALVGAAPVTS